MAQPKDTAPDASPIKPVSSLRSKFETLGKVPANISAAAQPSRDPFGSPGRYSLDLQRPQFAPSKPGKLKDTTPYGTHLPHASTSSPRSSSMIDLSTTPVVTIDSPKSPVRRVSPQSSFNTIDQSTPRSTSTSAPILDPLERSNTVTAQVRPAKPSISGPPPVNRAGKPSLLPQPIQTPSAESGRTPPAEPSPFSTPPSSSEGTPIDANSSKSLFTDTPVRITQSNGGGYFAARSSGRRSTQLNQPVVDRGRQTSAPIDSYRTSPRATASGFGLQISHLPAGVLDSATLQSSSNLRDVSPRTMSRSRAQPTSVESSPPLPARPLAHPAGVVSASATPTLAPRRKFSPPAVPAPRRSMDMRKSVDHRKDILTPAPQLFETIAIPESHSPPKQTQVSPVNDVAINSSDYPDTSQTNRRPPCIKTRAAEIGTGYETKLCSLAGEFVCTSGYVTRIWSTETGQPLASILHGENVRVTSLCWKPARELIDNDKRLWLGTGDGGLLEVDVAAGVIVHDRPNVHPRGQIVKIFRHASDMFTLDTDGRLLAWRSRPDKHAPNLGDPPTTLRVQAGHSASVIVRDQIWIAIGKDVRVYNTNATSDADVNLLTRPLCQDGAGEISSAATICDRQNQVLFGHVDGKITVYRCDDFSCLGIVNVSVYKISTLVGVGSHLWAGYNTGMIYAYDTTTTPWRVVKDWKAHSNSIAAIKVDQASIWEMGDLQVVSLGTDNVLRFWDGLLEDDWLVRETQTHDNEYCSFDELRAAVLTWNAGATKPSSLRSFGSDASFFQEYLAAQRTPDVLVFGFQELVDLEDKKLTAKSFFKRGKKDPSEQEHMSRQYRAWRDYLVKCVDDYMPPDASYTLLHTASMIGLFSCVFVKSDLRPRIKHVSTGEVKRGIGGLHGNKGALLLRLVVDSSSICLINCHLAAGQSQTTNRHNDIAAILESEILPVCGGSEALDTFVGGGDGSMIMDHETCILNGDLNYRIDAMTRDAIIRCVREQNLTKPLDRDQLLLSRKRNPGFRLRAFTESPITFAPTYKYNVGTDEYDTSEKKRSPAWCDRILCRGARVKCTEYRRWDEIRASDHRPVSGRFRVQVKKVDTTKRTKAVAKAEKAFVRYKGHVAYNVKLDYLVNVYGLAIDEAANYLKTNP